MQSNFAKKMIETGAPVYVVEGKVTDTDAHEGTGKLGDTEWQFSDGPPGERGYSEDYLDLMEGLRDFAGAKLIFDLEPQPEEESYEWGDVAQEKLAAIRALISGNPQHPALLTYGPMGGGDIVTGILNIVHETPDALAAKCIGEINPHYVVDGLENSDPESDYAGDGQFPPFRIFVPHRQDYVKGEYTTRQEAEAAAFRLMTGEEHEPE